MKGTVFTLLQDMVEEKLGVDVWEEIIAESNLESGGVYTSAQHYPDQEAFALVGALHAKTGAPVEDLLQGFGEYMFEHLHNSLPESVETPGSYFDYLESVHSHIHVEVRKLDQEATLPDLFVIGREGDTLTLDYQSPRGLCHLAIGLLKGAAKVFDEEVEVTIPGETYKDDGNCHIAIKKVA